MNLPFGNLAGPFAKFLLVIEHLAQFAAISAWYLAIHAHIKELAVLRVGVARMGDGHRFVHFRALEFENIRRFASGDAHLVRPSTNAGFRIEDKARGTSDHIKLAINTIVELVADAGLLMAEVSVLSGTMVAGLRLLYREYNDTIQYNTSSVQSAYNSRTL